MLENAINRTELSTLGEFRLIKHLTQTIELKNPSTVKGVGDDAAVLDFNGKQVVTTTDMLVEGVHFDLSYTPLKHLGYKSVVVNVSDVYAMNATPKQILISIAVSNRFSLEALEEFYAGVYLACEKYKVDVVGGDTTTSPSGFVISVTAIGEVEKDKAVFRSGAKVNDLICVSGDLGAAYLGLQVLEREKRIFLENPKIQPDIAGHDYILERQLKPEARKDIIELLKKMNIQPTSMIDISDGLSSELLHICNESKVGCAVYEEKIPIDVVVHNTALDFNLDPTMCALSGGEDYELLFTVDLKDHDKVKDNSAITIIGHITEKDAGSNLVTKAEQFIPLQAQGWDALLSRD